MDQGISRRDFAKNAGRIAAAGALAGVAVPHVYAQESNTIQIALVGCGGRGTGAVGNAFTAASATNKGPLKVVSMADVFESRLSSSYKSLKAGHNEKIDVPNDRKFIGFDGYKHAIDSLKKGDIAIFATPPAFRWVHFKYAIEKGVNVFMEKPVTVDGPSTKKMLALAEQATAKNMKVGVGLMCRHCRARKELYNRIMDGQIGDILLMRAYRMHGPVAFAFSGPKPEGISPLMYQVQRFHSFLWASGGLYSDFYIHNIDESCWMKDTWPVRAHGVGGRHQKGNWIDQNFDNYSVEYTFDDGTKLFLEGRCMDGTHNEFASYAHGTKGIAVISTNAHTPARCRIYKGQNLKREALQWAFPEPEPNPYDTEWEDLLEAIRQDKPYNEAKFGAEASLVTSMGRMAAHTGQNVTFDQALNHDHEFAPNVDQLTLESEPPVKPGPDGKYPAPDPGKKRNREY
jgi:predicted dehydrogenase